MHQKRAQAAMEFLATYGWAILVVLVVIAALAYFGVLSPSKFLPEKCTFQPGILCKDFSAMTAESASKVINFPLDPKSVIMFFDLFNSGENMQFRGGSITNDKGMSCLELRKECASGTELQTNDDGTIKVEEGKLCLTLDKIGKPDGILWPSRESLRNVIGEIESLPILCYPKSELNKGDKLSGTVTILYSKPGSDIIHESYGEFSFTVN